MSGFTFQETVRVAEVGHTVAAFGAVMLMGVTVKAGLFAVASQSPEPTVGRQ
jgi:hypothetical protein